MNRFINLVKQHGIKEKGGAPRSYTSSYEQPQHVLDLSPYAPSERLYEFLESEAALVKHKQTDGTTTQRWRMLACNTKDPSTQEMEHLVLSKYAIITKDSGPERSNAVQLGEIAVQVLYNVPFELSWTGSSGIPHFMAVVSLVRWKETVYNAFDFNNIPFRTMSIDEPEGKDGWNMRGMYWIWQTDVPGPIRKTMWTGKTKLDTAAIMAEDFDVNDFPFFGSSPDQNATDDENAAYKLVQMTTYQLVGMVGTKRTITQMLDGFKTMFISSLSRNMFAGPYNVANMVDCHSGTSTVS